MECTNFDRFKEPDDYRRDKGIYEICCECGEDILIESDTVFSDDYYLFDNDKGGVDYVCEDCDCLEKYCERFKRKGQ